MAKYRAKADLYVDEVPGKTTPVLIKAGTEFTSSREPGKNWEPLDAAGRSAAVARFGASAVPEAPVKAKAAAKPMTAKEKAAAKKAKAEADADAEAAAVEAALDPLPLK